ncbi:class I SAM-dependent methyltransferase [Thalassotalea mangrovi]|uniref:Methyltransferase domain-containing protein n=1 Tax=Thalassotalea mangrovi TaxID=2572245 RepID=A0A4U1B3C4_9GAMM|nr:class I SAM-dependent methyltransferase [Thalassotalea mangrovi]TKB43646.1 methyltransferase domain-containing protein [Thalassotalea mangrovi]
MDKYAVTVDTFNRLADKYQSKYMDFAFYQDTYDIFCSLLTSRQARIFEIGCGPGNISKYILDKHADLRLHGIDLAPNMVTLARQNNPHATFEVMDSREIGSINESYDAVICGFCTPYLAKNDVAKLIRDIRQLLNTGGILYLSTMEGDDAGSGLQTSSAGDQVFIHYHQFEFLKSELTANDFELLNVVRKQFPVESGDPATDLFIYAKAV